MSSLMSLPAELRIQILKELLTFEDSLELADFAREYMNPWNHFGHTTYAILHVCKEFWFEGIKIIYSENTIHININRNYCQMSSYIAGLMDDTELDNGIIVGLPKLPPLFPREFRLRHLVKDLELRINVFNWSARPGTRYDFTSEWSLEDLDDKLCVLPLLHQWGFDNLRTLTISWSGKGLRKWLWGAFPGFPGEMMMRPDEAARRKQFLDQVVRRLEVMRIQAREVGIGEGFDDEARERAEGALAKGKANVLVKV